MINKHDENDKEHESQHWIDMLSMNIVSSTDCTGMIQTPPLTDDEVDGYSDIFHMPQQKDIPAQKADSPEEQEKKSN